MCRVQEQMSPSKIILQTFEPCRASKNSLKIVQNGKITQLTRIYTFDSFHQLVEFQ